MNKHAKLSLAILSVAFSFSAFSEINFHQDSILASSSNTVYEFSSEGLLLSQTEIPLISIYEVSRDLIILDNGDLAVYNGTFTPELSIYNGTSWESIIVDGWSSVNNSSYGGITNVGNTVIVTDNSTGNGGEDKGLVAIDLGEITSNRFIDSNEYIDITLGEDMLLYALKNTYGDLDVIDPITYEIINSLDLGHTSSSRSVTANRDGLIYMVSWSGYIAQYDATGVLLKTLPLSSGTHDIDIDNNGRILVGSRFGNIYITDETLSSYQTISVSSTDTFVAFASPVQFEVALVAPVLEGSHRKKGRNILTTLNWATEANAVDVYFNGEFLETISNSNSTTYSYFKKMSQEFMVCNIGTLDCSDTYVSK